MRVCGMWPVALLLWGGLGWASPSPSLPWTTARFEVPMKPAPVVFELACPGGTLTSLTARQGDTVAELPIKELDRLVDVDLSTCSGARTLLQQESVEEGDFRDIGVTVVVALSHGYTRADLWVSLELSPLRFTSVEHVEDGSSQKLTLSP